MKIGIIAAGNIGGTLARRLNGAAERGRCQFADGAK